MAAEIGWQRGFPFHELNLPAIECLLQTYARGVHVLQAEPFTGGRRNSNYLLRLSNMSEPVVLRVFSAQEPRACCIREAALAQLISARVPMAQILHSQPDSSPPWNLLTYVDGPRFDFLLRDGAPELIAKLSHSAGQTLAAIHSFGFPAPGWLNGRELSIGPPPWPNMSWSEMLLGWFADGTAGRYLDPTLQKPLIRLIQRNAERVSALSSGSRLVHADYKGWNLLTRNNHIAAVLDWEFAYSGNPLVDFGIYLRYSDAYPPEFRNAFAVGYREGGGTLPDDWFELARLQDLTNLGYFLEFRGTDSTLVRDVTRLIKATVTLFAA